MPTNGFSIKPLKVKLLEGEQKATELADVARPAKSTNHRFTGRGASLQADPRGAEAAHEQGEGGGDEAPGPGALRRHAGAQGGARQPNWLKPCEFSRLWGRPSSKQETSMPVDTIFGFPCWGQSV